MNTHHTFMKHVPVLCKVIGWVLIYLAVLAEAEFQDETGLIIKIPGEYRIHSNPIKKTKTSSEKYKNSHNKRERQTLLREFVLGDFTPYVQDTSDDEKNSDAEIRYGDKTFAGNNNEVKENPGATSGIFTKDEINTRKRNNKIHKLLKGITARLKSNQVDIHKTNERDKVHNKKSKYSHRRKWKERRFEHNIKHQLKGNLFDINLKKNKNSNNHRAEDDKTFPLKFKKTGISKSGFPYGYYDNFAFEYNNLSDNFDIYDKTYNYFLPDENGYNRNLKYRVDDRTWHKNKNGGASQKKLQEPIKKLPRNLNGKLYESLETSAYNPLKQIRIGNAIITKNDSDQYKNKANRNVQTKIHASKLESKFRNEDGILKKSYRENSIKVQNNYDIDGEKRDKTERIAKDYHRGSEVINYKNGSAIKCNGNCSTAKVFGGSENNGSQLEIPCNEHEWCKYGNNGSLIKSETNENDLSESRKHQRKFYTLLKNTMEGRLHNTISHSHNRNGKLALKPTSFDKKLKAQKKRKTNKNNTIEDNSLLQQMFNIPVKLIVNFVRKYILGNKDPGEMVLKDIWQLPKSRLNKHSNARSKTDLKISDINQKKTKNNYKISFKNGNLKTMLRNRHKSKTFTRTFKTKATKEANAVTRTLLSNERKSALKGSKSFIELINVLIDGRLLHKSKYLNDVYKKSFLPKTEESSYFSENNVFRNSELTNKKQDLPKKIKLIHDPYFIPITRKAGNRPDWKNKNNILLKKAPFDFNVKRSDIHFPDGLTAYKNGVESVPRLSETLNSRQSIQSFDMHSLDNNLYQDNQFQNKYQHFYDNGDMLSFQYPWNNVDNDILSQYTIPKSNEEKSYSDLNTKRKTQKQYYKPILTLQETTHKPPPYTFQIYDGNQAPKGTSWNQIKSIKDESKQDLKYRGIFGNNDEDLQRSCIDVGKQDYIEFCPSGWVSFKQFCFFLDEETHSWSEVPDKCSRKNSKMAMTKSQEVIAFLVDKLSSKKHYTRPYFVGLRKIDEEWEWIDDTPLSRGLSDKIESNFHSCAVIQEGSLRKMPCNFKAGYICEMKTGIEASRVLTVGDSLTKGYFHGGKRFHPYGAKLEVLLNKDDHRCFEVEISGKNGEQSDNMLQRLSYYLNTKQRTYNWVLILAGTNDLLMSESPSDKIADQIIIMHEVAHARGAKSLVITIPEIFCERTNCPGVKKRRQIINKHLRIYAAAAGSKVYLSDLALKLSLHQLSLEDRKSFWEPSGVHLKAKGYDKMAEIIFKDLMESIESPIL